MADNYLEKKMEALQARKAKEARAKQIAWKKRMDAYRKKLEAEQTAGEASAAAMGAGAGEASAAGGDTGVAIAGAVAAGDGPEKSV